MARTAKELKEAKERQAANTKKKAQKEAPKSINNVSIASYRQPLTGAGPLLPGQKRNPFIPPSQNNTRNSVESMLRSTGSSGLSMPNSPAPNILRNILNTPTISSASKDAQTVKLKDVITGLPAAAKTVGKNIVGFGKSVIQAPPRAALSIGLSTPLGKNLGGEINPSEFGIQKIIGDSPIKSLQKQNDDMKQFLSEHGIKGGNFIAPIAVAGTTGLDLWFGSGNSAKKLGGKAIEKIAKTKSAEEISKILSSKNIPHSQDLLNYLVKAEDSQTIEKALDVYGKKVLTPAIDTKIAINSTKKAVNEGLVEYKAVLQNKLNQATATSNANAFIKTQEELDLVDNYLKNINKYTLPEQQDILNILKSEGIDKTQTLQNIFRTERSLYKIPKTEPVTISDSVMPRFLKNKLSDKPNKSSIFTTLPGYVKNPLAKSSNISNESNLLEEAKKYKSAEEFADWGVIMKKDPVVNGKNIGKDFKELESLVSYRKTSDFLKYGEYKFNEGVLRGKIGAGQELIQGKVNHWKERISKGERPIVIIEDKPYISKITDNLHGGRQYDAILEARVRQGHSRLEAYRQLGIKKIPVVYKSQLTDIWNKANQAGDDLMEQARKFKSAEEFVKAQNLYHGTNEALEGGSLSFGKGAGAKKGGQSGGLFLSDKPEVSQVFGKEVYHASPEIKKQVIDLTQKDGISKFENFIGKSYKTFEGDTVEFTKYDFDAMFPGGKADFASISQYPELVEKIVKDNKFRGVAFNEYAGGKIGKTYQILEGDIPVKTKSQLTDIWNKAHSTTLKDRIISGLNKKEKGSVLNPFAIKSNKVIPKDQSVLEGATESQKKNVLDLLSPQSQTSKKGLNKKVVQPPTVVNPRVNPSWVSKVSTSIREIVQDNWIRVKKLQKEAGVDINAKDLTPYQAETLMHGRIQARLDAVKESISKVDELIVKAEKSTKDTKIGSKIDQYLIAKHTPERNAIHGENASGMTNAKAKEILDGLKDNNEVKSIAEKIKSLNDQTLDILHKSQVISNETYTKLRSIYKNHIPLNRIMDDTNIDEYLIGKGLDVRSSGLKRAKGSDREVSDILTNVTANLEQAIVRSEKNRVNLATLKFSRENKGLGIFEEIKPKAIGTTFDGKPIMEKITDPNVLTIMEKGKPVYLRIKDEKTAMAFKAIGQEKLPAFMNFIGTLTRTFAGLATRFNPEFAFSNKLRDLQEMAIYMSAQKDIGFSGAIKTASRDTASVADVTAAIFGKNTEGSKLYKQMIADGGTTGGMALSTRKQLEIDIAAIRDMNRAGLLNAKKAGQKLLSSIDAWNTVFEDSTRLSVYKTALERGMTRNQAAYMAKNASLNFNKKGTGGSIINSLYMFSNASIQGSAKLLQSMKNPKVAAATITAVGSAVWATNKWNDRIDPEWRDKVDTFDRQSNLIVVLPTNEGVRYMTIPVSWGIKPIKVMSDYSYDAANGKANESTGFDIAGNVLSSLWNAYNPVGGTSLGSAIVPTIGDVPYDIATNTKWSGSAIRPNSKPGVPESINFFKNKEGVPSDKSGMFNTIKNFTGKIADVTEGNIQINPASLKYAIDSYLSGAGRSATSFSETVKSLATGKDLQTKDTPFIRRFMKDKSPEELTKTQGYNKKDTFKSDLQKTPRDKQPEKIQAYLETISDENIRKGTAYGLMMDGFNTKGTTTSTAVIKGRSILQKIDELDNSGNNKALNDYINNLTEEEFKNYKAAVKSRNITTTNKLKEERGNELQAIAEKMNQLEKEKKYKESGALADSLTEEEWKIVKSYLKKL